ncbi:serine/threonine-protein kinase [Phycicoccus sp. 3266]|uniref:serine/threonine-protein kinase n=1 Tax=Phycicoccus sp. 3266 TaxID=2817751 RepID=UPI00285FD8BC|nr:serine/threonine-protein kinase [Phycicoccus sp. 3266]MDR6863260.1 serine/threonine-protein kinase [Phycicoccus sp. 3266]
MSFETGQVLASRYHLTERIAAGGMGEVWRAHDATLDRDVAVKVLRPDGSDDAAFVERFHAEARHSGGLSHPNIGTVHDFGDDSGTAYLVMELLEGEPLSAIIRERAPLPQEEVRDILVQTARALQAAHEAGVVHRDVKPANIVVNADGYAKLTDFGIARALNEAPMTQTGEVLGTPHYLSPEQAQGEPAGPLSDVYALAVVGYEMLTGRRPFSGDTMVTTALAHVSQPAPQLSDEIGEPLRTTVMAALAKDPAKRPPSAAEFAEALSLPDGEVPEHLLPGARSAVSPVVAGAPGLAPDEALPTSVLVTTPAQAALRVTESTVEHDTRRPAWLLPVVGLAAVLLVLVLALALGGRAGGSTSGKTTNPTPAGSVTTRATSSTPTTARTTSTTTTAKPAASQPQPPPAHQPGKGKGKGEKKK